MYRTLLKDQGEMPKTIVTDRDTALMISIAKAFPSSNALLYRYHIIKSVRSQVKPTVGMKQIESEDEKMVKARVVVEKNNGCMESRNKFFHKRTICRFRDAFQESV